MEGSDRRQLACHVRSVGLWLAAVSLLSGEPPIDLILNFFKNNCCGPGYPPDIGQKRQGLFFSRTPPQLCLVILQVLHRPAELPDFALQLPGPLVKGQRGLQWRQWVCGVGVWVSGGGYSTSNPPGITIPSCWRGINAGGNW